MSDLMQSARCSARSKRSGEQCKRTAVAGATVCTAHGGKAPQVRAAAERRVAEAAAATAVATFGLPREVDPHEALLEELHRTAGAVSWLQAQVAVIETAEVVWGKTQDKKGGDDWGTTHAAGVNVWVQLYQSERKHLVEVSKACVTAGIEERRIRLAESSGQLLASVVRAVLERLGLSPEQRELASIVVPEEFRRVAELDMGGGA